MRANRRIENIRNILNNSFGNAELRNEVLSNLVEIENECKELEEQLEKEREEIINRLNNRMIHPEKDTDLLLDELSNFGISFDDESHGWILTQNQSKDDS